MFECFKSKLTRMKKARRLTIESQRYQKIAGLLGPAKDDSDDEEKFAGALELVKIAQGVENASCGCDVCALLRRHKRATK